MVRRRRNTGSRATASKTTPQKTTKRIKRSTGSSLKEKLMTTGIWGLSLLNIALIFSLISNFFSSPNEVPASAGLSRIETPKAKEGRRITVEVLNGCGVNGLAYQVSDYLRKADYDVVNFGDYQGGWNLAHTLIFDRVSLDKKYADKVAKTLDVPSSQVVPELEDSVQLMVTVIVGKDYKKMKIFTEKE